MFKLSGQQRLYFYEYDCKESNLNRFVIINVTIFFNYIGNKDMFQPVLTSRIKGVDRIVPIGKTMDFDLIWDGYNLLSYLTKFVILHQ